jgi:hypothetical protein
MVVIRFRLAGKTGGATVIQKNNRKYNAVPHNFEHKAPLSFRERREYTPRLFDVNDFWRVKPTQFPRNSAM